MKKKLLFIAPGYYGFNEVVFEGLKNYSDYEVVHINSTLPYQYKNIYEKIYNFFLKTFLGKNLKNIKRNEHIQSVISSSYYDVLLVNRPDVLSKKDFDLAIKNSKYSIALFWDSIQKIPSQEEYINKFNICCSFDSDDCEKYNLKHVTNFYFVKDKDSIIKYDVSYLATYDKRIEETLIFFNYFNRNSISAKGRIFTYKSTPIKQNLPKTIEVISEIIPFSISYSYYLDSKIILDIAHPHQKGLSFRPYEAIGLQKKLITTNQEIVHYDFYNPKNILIIENIGNFNIPQEFITADYEEPAGWIKEKYYIKNWIKTILSINEN
ncbi:lipopolysaccharide core biosynthesis protein rfaS [Chryseobacterium sp. ISL-6]|uniref:lipopolysaccharide core biosynthesis protein rfaS n=1 Tax=Chryseobacterium sp. ISL-6 TaxID=2819143 RepID=UPI001BE61A29|nr:lipopolysaccharide core biosynthesis protein rfaS [Chryseobacterium sp. ISL-6]MBT2620642.1 lipopolysaccharide core biosynthesis protein rfaS [Chryseobacterium sp. ISL-6]